MVFVIYSANFDPASGGNSITHHLCHNINRLLGSGNAYLCPPIQSGQGDFDFFNNNSVKLDKIEDYDETKFTDFKVNPLLDTPIVTREILLNKNNVVIYTEGIYGNPLGYSKVVRWILFFAPPNHVITWKKTDMFVFYTYCYYNTYNFFYKEKDFLTNMVSEPFLLTLVNYRPGTFVNTTPWKNRWGTCYTKRKGSKGFYFPVRGDKNKDFKLIHSLRDSVNFEYESHLTEKQINELFNKSRIFYAYDPFTFLSLQAALSGCVSVMVPIPGLSKEKLFEKVPHMEYGVAYGLEDIDHALNTMHLVHYKLIEESNRNDSNIIKFCQQTEIYFNRISSDSYFLEVKEQQFLKSLYRLRNLPEEERVWILKNLQIEHKELPKALSWDPQYGRHLNMPELGLLRGWINFNQLSKDARKWTSHFSNSGVDSILTNSKLSSLVGGILSLHLNIPIVREIDKQTHNKTLVLVDDLSEKQIEKVINDNYQYNTVYGAVYSSNKIDLLLDYRYKFIPEGVAEWNFRHSRELWKDSMVDFDGVLSYDPPKHYFKSSEEIEKFHLNAAEYMYPYVEMGIIVTGRREKFRKYCLEWLTKKQIKFEDLIMNGSLIQDLSTHPYFKAIQFSESDKKYFIESEVEQSIIISEISQKPVLCIDDMQVYYCGEKVNFEPSVERV